MDGMDGFGVGGLKDLCRLSNDRVSDPLIRWDEHANLRSLFRFCGCARCVYERRAIDAESVDIKISTLATQPNQSSFSNEFAALVIDNIVTTNSVMPLQDSVSFFLSQYNTTTEQNGAATSSQKDETETFGMEDSEDGLGIDEDEFGYMKKHPSKRRKRRANQISIYILVGFCLLMVCAIVPLSRRKKSTQATTTTTTKQKSGQSYTNKSQNKEATSWQETKVYCDGKGSYAFDEWLEQDLHVMTTMDLCDPEFLPERVEADMRQPVKVFIMLGESNMVGAGQTNGNMEGTLEYTVLNKQRFTHLVDLNQEWHSRSDVRYVAVKDEMTIERNEWLGVDTDYKYFGPELQFGFVLGELYDEPVLLIKAAAGHHSLGGDLLPPGSPAYNYGEWTYPGYGESPRRWPSTVDPSTLYTTWYAGRAYDTTLHNIKSILSNIGEYYPGATEYQVEGIAFWQGDSDRRDSAYTVMYQRNLRNLIASLRTDLQVPDAKVAIASIGQLGDGMSGNALQILESQMSMGSLYRDFQGNVLPIDIRSSWRGPYLPGYDGDSAMVDAVHYGNNAETVMEVGNALGLAMAKLVNGIA